MGSVSVRTERDDEARKARRSRMSPMRAVKVFALIAAVVLLLGFLGGCTEWDISAICPKCLQHTRIYELRCFGLPVYWRTQPAQGHGGIGSSEAFSPAIPHVSPALYERIWDTPCKHHYQYGGYGRTSGCLHADGSFMHWAGFIPRIRAMEGLYAAFSKTEDVKTARAIYLLIDGAYPTSGLDMGDVISAGRIAQHEGSDERAMQETREYLYDYDDPRSRLQITALELCELAARLADVKTAADFRQVLEDFEPRLKPALGEE